jgi:hypothetical protein
MRVLRNEKANYSQRGAEVTFYWLKGAFVTEDQMPKGNDREMRESAQAASQNDIFLRLLDTLTKQRRQVSHAPNVPTYAPKIMAAMQRPKGSESHNWHVRWSAFSRSANWSHRSPYGSVPIVIRSSDWPAKAMNFRGGNGHERLRVVRGMVK